MPTTDPLTDDEQRLFSSLLRPVCDHHVDNWISMRLGQWYIEISLRPPAGAEHADDFAAVDEETRLTRQSQPPPTYS